MPGRAYRSTLRQAFLVLFLSLCLCVITSASSPEEDDAPAPRRLLYGRAQLESNASITNGSSIVYNETIANAERIVAEAVEQQGIYNAYRFKHPRRNSYKPGQRVSTLRKRDDEPIAPHLNDTVIAAAALIAEVDAKGGAINITTSQQTANDEGVLANHTNIHARAVTPTPWWVPLVKRDGLAPMNSGYYPVWRDVTDPQYGGGAKGDGKTDDTAAINAAIAAANNCGKGCLSSSIKGTLIYFPSGTYLISSPINAYYYTQIVGNAVDIPTIKTAPSFIGLGAIQSDVYIPNQNGDEWYIWIRNFNIDISQTTTDSVAALHWQVGQATSLQNIVITASKASGTTQKGIFTENGSSGFMSDVTIIGGAYGLYGGNQQYTVRAFSFLGQTKAAICLIWDWGWTWSGLRITGVPIGILLLNPDAGPPTTQAGSIYLMDSYFDTVGIAIKAQKIQEDIKKDSVIVLDNIGVKSVTTMVGFLDGSASTIPAATVDFWMLGNMQDGRPYTAAAYGLGIPHPDDSLAPPSTAVYARRSYFAKSRPQYEGLGSGAFLDVKSFGAKGDGLTDDTAAIKSALAAANAQNVVYFPSGSYVITSTIVVPSQCRITGRVWSQLVARGPAFGDITKPTPMIKVGNPGDVGTVEFSDILFTSIGALPGLVMVEWNVAAEKPGSVGMWDTHFRVGGAIGTKLQVADCPRSSPIKSSCMAASMMMHITPSGNGYFENVWAWVADHDLDDAQNTQITVAVARGILVESPGPTWLYGTASEHSMLYQYNFQYATNTFAGMIQTESPYFQYTEATKSSGAYAKSVGLFTGDPDFANDKTCHATDLMCDYSWSTIVNGVTNLTIASAGLYSWFDNYNQDVCVDAQNCQQRMFLNSGSNVGFRMFNLITIGGVEMLSNIANGLVVYAKNNTQTASHPFWSVLGGYLDDSANNQVLECDDDDISDACSATAPCDYTKSFATLDDLANAADSFRSVCADYYALGTLQTTLQASVDTYNDVNNGYDKVFGDYVDYVTASTADDLSTFMADDGKGNQYFQCTYTAGKKTITHQCPITADEIGFTLVYTITYKLTDSTGFYNALSTTYSIPQDWVKFDEQITVLPCGDEPTCPVNSATLEGIPMVADNLAVPNPKDIVTAALGKVPDLQDAMWARQMDIVSGQWASNTDDPVQVLSLPAMTIMQGIDSMAMAKQIGQKEAAIKKKDLILEILGIVFALIPFVDDVAPEVVAAARIGTIVGDAGTLAESLYDIVTSPADAWIDILGAVTGGSALGADVASIAKLANARRGMTDLKKLGPEITSLDGKLQTAVKLGSCKV
ncbi:hypothetical protein B9Z65_1216 [Elsinoe australis]|uniref:Rhamnogalacturonase A/B/Epimerase-like pectate lyase domain-containing protein n=1 Tax=Elsinoe australis TaxID=40998 RepID=A0A2P7YPX3_9PEZI|nr:hypothetical protein B9Z65_1216 [Elsinoe australis]